MRLSTSPTFATLRAHIILCSRKRQGCYHVVRDRAQHAGYVPFSESVPYRQHLPVKTQRYQDNVVVGKEAIKGDSMPGERFGLAPVGIDCAYTHRAKFDGGASPSRASDAFGEIGMDNFL